MPAVRELPDAGVLVAPGLRQEVGGLRKPRAGAGVQAVAQSGVQPRRVHEVPVRSELKLSCGVVAVPNGAAVPVAAKRKLELVVQHLAAQPIYRLDPRMRIA